MSFLCTGNICRSPMAAIVFTEHLRWEGLDDRVRVTSSGTGGWHVGNAADPRTADALRRAGYDATHVAAQLGLCLLYTSPSPRDRTRSRMPSSA